MRLDFHFFKIGKYPTGTAKQWILFTALIISLIKLNMQIDKAGSHQAIIFTTISFNNDAPEVPLSPTPMDFKLYWCSSSNILSMPS